MDVIKQITGKNKFEYEQAAAHIINNADVETFKLLIDKDDFLFDFIKQNVANRLEKACNENNYKNLLKFFKYYSPSYDDFIVKILAEFADKDVLSQIKNLLKNGSENEKSYATKFYAYHNDNSVTEDLKNLAFSANEAIAINSAMALSSLKDKSSIDIAKEKLKSEDDFEILSAIKFISVYGEKSLINDIFKAMKNSSVSEYIACEIGYMESFLNLIETNYEDTLLAILNILDGLGEIIPLCNVYPFQFFELFEKLINSEPNSKSTIVLLTAQNKFNQLTENDEYLFDEDKNTKTEIHAIKNLLNDNLDEDLVNLISTELKEESPFAEFALNLTVNKNCIRNLLSSKNQTLVLKALETLKKVDEIQESDRKKALKNINNANIKSIIEAL